MKKRLVIIKERDVGLFSLFLQVVNCLQLIEQLRKHSATAYVPIVCFQERCCYYSTEGHKSKRNVWEYYFEPLNLLFPEEHLILLSDADRDLLHSTSIVTSDYYPTIDGHQLEVEIPHLHPVDSTHREIAKPIIDEYIRPRSYIQEKIDRFHRENLTGCFTIGVHIRGTDATVHRFRKRAVDLDKYAREIERTFSLAEGYGRCNTRILLATDEEQYVSYFRGLYGDNLTVYPAVRETRGRKRGRGPTGAIMPPYLCDSVRLSIQNGEDAVVEYYLLTKCNYFIHNISSLSRAVLLTCPELKSCDVDVGGYEQIRRLL